MVVTEEDSEEAMADTEGVIMVDTVADMVNKRKIEKYICRILMYLSVSTYRRPPSPSSQILWIDIRIQREPGYVDTLTCVHRQYILNILRAPTYIKKKFYKYSFFKQILI